MHYNFVLKPDMEREIAAGKFLEFAHVHDNIYGTSLAAVEKVAAAGRGLTLVHFSAQPEPNLTLNTSPKRLNVPPTPA